MNAPILPSNILQAATSNARSLLSAALSHNGYCCIVGIKLKPDGTTDNVHQQFFKPGDFDGAVTQALAYSNQGRNAYFCTSTMKSELRNNDNVQAVKAFRIDLDVNPDDAKKYVSKEEAVANLRRFCKEHKMPKPVIVDSGYGYHCYWILNNALNAVEGKAYSLKFKMALIKLGLKMDRSVPADCARILRMPGTVNFKIAGSPKKVELLTDVFTFDNAELLAHIERLAECGKISGSKTSAIQSLFDGAELPDHLKHRPLDNTTKALMHYSQKFFEVLLNQSIEGTGCRQIADIYLNQESMEEPKWRAGISVAAHCVDWEKAIHMISDKYGRYDFNETVRKAEYFHIHDRGPYKCSTFKDNWPEQCVGCQHDGRITSPIQLGMPMMGSMAIDDISTHRHPGTNDWPVPEPFCRSDKAVAYPVSRLPPSIRDAVMEVQQFTQAPISLVAASALSCMSIAAQGYFDVRRDDRLVGPISLFTLVLAESGERKTTCDGFFKLALTEYEREKIEAAKPDVVKFKASHTAWEATRSGFADAIKAAAKKGADATTLEQRLQKHQDQEPLHPLVPRILYSDATQEQLTYNLAKVWPSAGILSAEAGAFLGSHAMSESTVMRMMAALNSLWDGGRLTYDRRTSESYVVEAARLTVGLQLQPAALREFLSKTGGLARGIGFFARFLVAWPESTQGTRFYRAAPTAWPAVSQFQNRLRAILSNPLPIDMFGTLRPSTLVLSPDAKQLWIDFHDKIEAQLCQDGDFSAIRDVASKIADNAARIAGIFHVAEGMQSDVIGAETFRAACALAEWHLHEAKRFFGMVSISEADLAAQRLDEWLIAHSKNSRNSTSNPTPVTKTQILQKGPSGTRSNVKLMPVLKRLQELGRIRVVQEGQLIQVWVNPALFDADFGQAA